MTALLEANGLTVRYDGRPAVSNVSFEIQPGRVLGVIGESGSGKTSVAMAVLGLLAENAQLSGSIHFDGQDLSRLSERELRPLRGRHLAAIIQNATTSLDPCYTIGSQFEELLRAHETITKKDARAKALEWLRHVDLREPERCMRAYPHELSGGMNQRVMIGMALSLGPKVLVADEPTSALDVTVQARILRLLKSLIEDSDVGVLLITHDLGVVQFLATDVVVMRDGQIVESGPVTQVFAASQHEYTRKLFAAVPGGRRNRSGTGHDGREGETPS
jgi:ABC-type microcin C transport system duplicated ATPase subunit YejF